MCIYLYWKGDGMHTMIAATEYKDSQVDAAVYALKRMIKEIDSLKTAFKENVNE